MNRAVFTGEKEMAMKRFIEKIKEVKKEVKPEDMEEQDVKILTEIWNDYSRGIIGCEMVRISEKYGLEMERWGT